MEYNRSEIKVGLLLVAGLLLLVVFFAVINRWSVAEHWEVTAVFTNVMGLKRDAGVQYAGRLAGWVDDLRYLQVRDAETGKNVTHVELVLAVAADVPLTDKDVAHIERSLTGEVVVEIQPGPGTPYQPGKTVTLTSKEVPTFALLMEEMDKTMLDVSRFAKEQRPVLEEALANFRDTFARTRALLAQEEGELRPALVQFRRFAETATALLDENRKPVQEAIASAGDVFARARSLTKELEPGLKDSTDALQDITTRLRTFLSERGPELGDTVSNLRELSENLNQLITTNRPRVGATLEDLRRTAANIRMTVEDLRRNPWKLVLRPLGSDAYTQNIYDTARSLVLSAGELARTAEQLERLSLEEPSAAEQARIDATLEDLRQRLERSAALQEELWGTLKKPR